MRASFPLMPLRGAWLAGLTAALAVVAIVLLALAPGAGRVEAAATAPQATEPVEVTLLTAEDGVAPDATRLSGGLLLRLGEGWKTYWRSPGEVGLPPEIDWEGSENLAEAKFLWPAPKRFRAFGIENFGYSDEVLFPLDIRLERPGEPVSLAANVSLLVCSEVCVPQDFDLTLEIAPGTGIDTASAALIAQYAAQVPDDGARDGISFETAALAQDLSALTVTVRSATPFDTPDVFPELGEDTAFGVPDIRLGDGGRLLWAKLPVLSAGDERPPLRLTVTDGARAATFADAPLGAAAATPPFALDAVVPGVSELAWIALVAVLGGLILNVMPCVLPVLSIKLSSAVKARGQSRARVRGGFLVSALGVMSFMWLLAGGTLAARGLGLSVGWGLQFQNPVFLAAMIVLLTLFAANLLGLFEISLPQSWNSRMARADGQPGYGGDFATGAFAAVLATPCSAPFLGTAVAFALAGRPLDIVVIFTALGLGLALPYLAVAAAPRLVLALPRPGGWMVWLKLVLGLLLAVTAAWLFWVLFGVAGQPVVLAVAALLATTVLLLWQGGRLRAVVRAPALTALLAAALVAPMVMAPAEPEPAIETAWVPFDRAEIPRLVSAGQVVFVDVTADWCITCKANKALVLDRDPVASALAAEGVTPMQADWTRPDEAISRYLEAHDRFGIPFNVVYGPAAPEGIILPELLSTDAVMQALSDAGADLLAAGG